MKIEDVKLNIKLIQSSDLKFYPKDLYLETLKVLLKTLKRNDDLSRQLKELQHATKR